MIDQRSDFKSWWIGCFVDADRDVDLALFKRFFGVISNNATKSNVASVELLASRISSGGWLAGSVSRALQQHAFLFGCQADHQRSTLALFGAE